MSALALAGLLVMIVALLLSGIRLVRGPSDVDRLLAAETVALGLVGLLMIQVREIEDRFYVDAALGLALFSFVGTVVLARFLERGTDDE